MRTLKRRVLVALLVVVMAVSLTVPAFAADPSTTIYGTYSAEAAADKVISFGYNWNENMSFTYSAGSKGTWDPSTHSYSGGSNEGKWTADGSTDVTVTNHSNTAITVTLVFTANSGYESIKVGATDNGFTLATAEGTAVADAPSKTVKVGMTADSGALPEGTTNVALGTLTLKVTAA